MSARFRKQPTCTSCNHNFTLKENKRSKFIPRTPNLLLCGHSVCSLCIKNAQHHKIRAIMCQLCHMETQIMDDDDNPIELPVDVYLAGVSSICRVDGVSDGVTLQTICCYPFSPVSSNPNKEKTSINISNCERCEVSCVYICEQCNEFLCEKCFHLSHRKPGFLEHTHNPYAQQSLTYSLTNLCKEHESSFIYFCKSDEQFLCAECAVNEVHHFHEKMLISKRNAEFASDIKLMACRLQNVHKALERSKQELGIVEPKCKAESLKIIGKIRNEFSRLHGILQHRENELIEQVEKIFSEDNMPVVKLKKQVGRSIEKIEALLHDANLEQTTKEAHFDHRQLLECMKDMSLIPCNLIEFSGPETKDIANKASFKINEENVNVLRSIGSVEGEVNIEYSLIALEHIASIPNVLDEEPIYNEESDKESVASEDTSSRSLQIITRSAIENRQSISVAAVENPSLFYVQLASSADQLDIIRKIIEEWSEDVGDIPDKVEKDKLVMAQYGIDGVWYRAKIKVVDTHEDENISSDTTVRVYYIDYGNYEILPLSSIREMPEKLTEFNETALKCSLHNIEPATSDGWSQDAILTFVEMAVENPVQMTIENHTNELYSVDLFLSLDPDGSIKSIRETLVWMNLACFSLWDSFDKNIFYRPVNNFFQPDIPNPSSTMDVTLVHAEDPHCFYVQRSEGDYTDLYQEIQAGLLEFYGGHYACNLGVYTPIIGHPCVAQFRDGVWYRAQIQTKPNQEQKMLVYAVDVGYSEYVHWKKLRKIEDKFLQTPMLAIKCRLADIQPLKFNWSDNAIAAFASMIRINNKFSLLVVGKNKDEVSVVLYQDTPDCIVCINAFFVESKFAVSSGPYANVMKLPKPNDKLKAEKEIQPEYIIQPNIHTLPTSDDVKLLSALNNHIPRKEDNAFNELTVTVAHFRDPSCIYLHTEYAKKSLQNLSNRLKEKYYYTLPDRSYEWTEDENCVFCKHGEWYRGKMCEVLKEEKAAKVFSTDWGCTEVIPLEDLREIDSEHLEYEKIVILCHIVDIQPPGGTEVWPKTSCEVIEDIISEQNTFIMIQASGKNNGSMPIDLCYDETIGGGALEASHCIRQSIRQLLLDKGLALGQRRKRTESSIIKEEKTNVTVRYPDCNFKRSSSNQIGTPEELNALVMLDDRLVVPTTFIEKKLVVETVIKAVNQEVLQTPVNTADDCSSECEPEAFVGAIANGSEPVKLAYDSVDESKLNEFGYAVGNVSELEKAQLEKLGNDKDSEFEQLKEVITHQKELNAHANLMNSESNLENLPPLFSSSNSTNSDSDQLILLPHSEIKLMNKDNVSSKENQSGTISSSSHIGSVTSTSSSSLSSSSSITSIQAETTGVTSSDAYYLDSADNEDSDSQEKIWKPALLPKNTIFKGKATYIDFYGCIYLYDVENESTLELIKSGLNAKYKDSISSMTDIFWAPNELCIAKWKIDGNWYRGRIAKTDQVDGGLSYRVQYIDYGNDEIVESQYLRKDLACYRIPIQSYKCQLDGIYPKGVGIDSKWPLRILNFINKHVVDQTVDVKVMEFPPPDWSSPMKVQILLPNEQNVARWLLDLGFATRDSCFDKPITSISSLEFSCSDIADKPFSVKESVPNRSSYIPCPLPKVGEVIPISIIEVDISVTRLYIQRLYFQQPRNDYQFQANAQLNEISKINAKLTKNYKNYESLKNPQIGDLVTCFYNHDSVWYRGLICEERQNDYSVLFVDYGNKEYVTLKDLRKLPDELKQLPMQSIYCELDGIEIIPEKANQAKNELRKLFQPGKYNAKIKDVTTHPIKVDFVRLDKKTNSWNNLYQHLIDKNVVKEK